MAPCRLRFAEFSPGEERETYVVRFRLERIAPRGGPADRTQARGVLVVRFTSADWMDYAPDMPAEHPAALSSWILIGPGIQAYRARYGV